VHARESEFADHGRGLWAQQVRLCTLVPDLVLQRVDGIAVELLGRMACVAHCSPNRARVRKTINY